jgi:PKD domain/Bacterial Ig-like domain (group 1)
MSLAPRTTLFLALALVAAASGCDKVPLLAPTNSTIRLVAAVGVVPNGGTIDITAVVIESAGTPVQNGTVVSFTSQLGNIEPRESRTQNGQVTVKFTAGSQSGTAKIMAFSGGSKSDDLEVLVGAAAAAVVNVRADTTVLPTTGGTAEIIALVRDTGGNPLPNATVSFSTTAGQLSQSAALTNPAGEARTELRTNVKATVEATVGGGSSAPKGSIAIEVRELPTLKIEPSSPQSPQGTYEVGVPTLFKLTPEPATAGIRSATVEFGDGTRTTLGAVPTATTISHTYQRTGPFTVVATATDGLNFTGTSSTVLVIVERASVPIQINLVGNSTPNRIATLNAALAQQGGGFTGSIRTYQWDFGDGEGDTTTGPQVTHRYRAAGQYTVRVFVTTTTGQTGSNALTIIVS